MFGVERVQRAQIRPLNVARGVELRILPEVDRIGEWPCRIVGGSGPAIRPEEGPRRRPLDTIDRALVMRAADLVGSKVCARQGSPYVLSS